MVCCLEVEVDEEKWRISSKTEEGYAQHGKEKKIVIDILKNKVKSKISCQSFNPVSFYNDKQTLT